MKVLIFSQYFWPESFHINEVARTLLNKNIDVEVLTGKPNYPYGKIFTDYRAWGCQLEIYEGININRIPILARGGGGWRLVLNYLSFVLSGLIFSPWVLHKKKFDIIFIYAPSPLLQAIPAIFLGWIKGCSVVLWVQDLWPESLSATGHVKNRIVLWAIKIVVRFIYQHSDLLLVQSKAFEEPLRALVSNTPIKYFPNSVNISFTAPVMDWVPQIEGLGSGFSVMFAGNIGFAQAVWVIIEAASLLKKYPDINFVIVGDGSARIQMLREVQKRELNNLHLPGRLPDNVMPSIMQKASVLLATLANQPIFAATVPNKLQAYLAAGRPIIACLNGEGARLVVDAGAGLATPAEDARALADTILIMYKYSTFEREIMGNNGRKYYQKHFNHNRLIDQLIITLQDVADVGKDF